LERRPVRRDKVTGLKGAMNTAGFNETGRRGWVSRLLLGGMALVLGVLVVTPLLVPAALYHSFRPTSDLEALRAGVVRATGARLDREIELAVRPLAFAMVRAVTVFADIPEEARAAVRAIHSVELGVYQVRAAWGEGGPRGVLSAVDEAMAKRGWDRLVGVVDGSTVVAVFGPRTLPSQRDLPLAVLVTDGPQLVLAKVRGDPEVLATWALAHLRERAGGRRDVWSGGRWATATRAAVERERTR